MSEKKRHCVEPGGGSMVKYCERYEKLLNKGYTIEKTIVIPTHGGLLWYFIYKEE